MGNLILGKAYIPGLGVCYVEEGKTPEFFTLRHVKTGFTYSRTRASVNWRPATQQKVSTK